MKALSVTLIVFPNILQNLGLNYLEKIVRDFFVASLLKIAIRYTSYAKFYEFQNTKFRTLLRNYLLYLDSCTYTLTRNSSQRYRYLKWDSVHTSVVSYNYPFWPLKASFKIKIKM